MLSRLSSSIVHPEDATALSGLNASAISGSRNVWRKELPAPVAVMSRWVRAASSRVKVCQGTNVPEVLKSGIFFLIFFMNCTFVICRLAGQNGAQVINGCNEIARRLDRRGMNADMKRGFGSVQTREWKDSCAHKFLFVPQSRTKE